jgi:hypothetical protein
MPKGKVSKKREDQIKFFENMDKYKKDHGKYPKGVKMEKGKPAKKKGAKK